MRKLLLPLVFSALFLGLSAADNQAAAQRYYRHGGHDRHYRQDYRYDRRRWDCAPRYYERRYYGDYDCGPRYYERRYYQAPRYYRSYDCGPRYGISIRF
ncbi:MAG: hypothetical protein H6807_10540 [Planctomycetes bacterium]|nr:hypothetical protein [Planctomycetota bacterium]